MRGNSRWCRVRPRVFILPEVKKLLDSYIRNCRWEILGFGKVEQIGRDFLITSLKIFNQDVTAGSADMDPEQLHNFMIELIDSGEDQGDYKLFFHSHVDGEAYFSSIDDGTCSSFDNDWMISIVGNKYGEYAVRLDIFEPTYIVFNDLSLEVYLETDKEIEELVKKEIKEKVTFIKPKRMKFAGYGRFPILDDEEEETNGLHASARYSKSRQIP